MFRILNIRDQFRRPDVRRLHYDPSDLDHSPEAGLLKIREAALDVPVHLIRLERGFPVRLVREEALDARELSPGRLIPHVTAYGAAYAEDGQATLLIVARSPLAHVQPDGSNLPVELRVFAGRDGWAQGPDRRRP